MRQAVYYNNRDIRIVEAVVPKIGPQEVLVRVEASGICGSDVMEWYRKDKVPLILGHEVSGVIEDIGEEVRAYKKGDRIACAHHVPCGSCRYCLAGHETVCQTLRKTNFDPGGFCEYLRLPKINVDCGVFLLPEHLTFEEATFVEPLACVLRGQRLAGLSAGKSVLVLGAGIAGLLHIKLAKARGAERVIATDINEFRLQAAKKFGADAIINAREYSHEKLRQVNMGRLADTVIVSTGALPAITQAQESVEKGGVILFFAPLENNKRVNFSFNELFWRQEITLTSSYAGSPQDYREALELLSEGKLVVSDMVTHRLGLADIEEGFKLVAEADKSIKVIIFPRN